MKAKRNKTDAERLALSVLFLLGVLGYCYGWPVALGVGLIIMGLVNAFIHST